MNEKNIIEKCLEEAAYLLDEGAVKTSKKYKLDNYLKKYDYQGDKKQGTITVNGEKYKVDRNVNSPITKDSDGNTVPRMTSADLGDKDKKIILDKNFEKVKNNKRRDAMLQHEIGHVKYHRLTSDKTTPEGKDAALDSLTKVAVQSVPFASKDAIKAELNKKYNTSTKKELSEKDKIHDENLKKYKKYEKDSNPHANRVEYEADAYASQQKNGDQLSKALRDTYKHAKSKKGIDYQLKGAAKAFDIEPKYLLNDETRQQVKKSQNILGKDDYDARIKASKDKTINKQIYRESIENMLNETVELTK